MISPPWTLSLPSSDRVQFQHEGTEVLSRVASTGDFAELRMFLDDWRKTAELHADSALSSALGSESAQPIGSLVQELGPSSDAYSAASEYSVDSPSSTGLVRTGPRPAGGTGSPGAKV